MGISQFPSSESDSTVNVSGNNNALDLARQQKEKLDFILRELQKNNIYNEAIHDFEVLDEDIDSEK